ncbi:oligosaccharide flippase family protein [Candidatus Peregrinibacteria bacterium]|nr:MAG: oligosaccharide flippase family protein [Candidatus Peregrinibacteria bacterium]
MFISLQKEILWSTVVQILGKGLQIAIGIVTVKGVTTILGTENYGLYGKISEFSLFFATAANLGIFGNTVRRLSLEPKNAQLFGNALLLRLFTGMLFLGLGWIFALLTIEDPIFLLGTLFFMSSLLLDLMTTVCDALLQAHYKMGRATLALLLGRLTNLAVIGALSSTLNNTPEDFNLSLFLLGPLLAALVTLGLSFLFARQILKPKWTLNKTLLKDLFLSSLPFGIINILNNLYFRFLPGAFLVTVLSNSHFGIYNLNMHLSATLSILSTFFMFSVLPKLEQSLKKNDLKAAKLLYQSAKRILGLAALALVGLGTWLGPWALSLVSNKDFLDPETWFFLPLLLILTGVSYFYDLALLTLFALKDELWWMKREVLALSIGLLFGLSIVLLPHSTGLASVLILTGAIVAEGSIAFLGMRRIKKHLSA